MKAPEKGQLGKAQWAALNQAFKPSGGAFDKCDMVILVSTLPLVMYSSGWTRFVEKFVDDAQEEWEFKHVDEHTKLLALMDDWKVAKKGSRELFVVGGDVHHCGHTDIYRDGRRAFSQLVTSGICQELPKEVVMIFSKIMMGTSNKIDDEWTFSHHDWVKRNNYGLVSVNNSPIKKGRDFTVQLVTSVPKSKIKLERMIIYSHRKMDEKSACCTIF